MDFLLKFERDRLRWKHWLFQARKRYGLCVLNYIATSNHIHLLVQDVQQESISKSMQLISSRVAQEYNRRKTRMGAFWEDRYFATAVCNDSHLFKCLVYIDLNMVRAGVVAHPSHWRVSGYNEIQSPPSRYRIIDHGALLALGGFADHETLASRHQEWVRSSLSEQRNEREPAWSKSIAVGPKNFVVEMQECLGMKTLYRPIRKASAETFVIEDA
jgi:putative transposase